MTRIDRLARSVGDLQNIVQELKAKGAFLIATEQPIDMSTSTGKMFIDLLGVFAEFENALRRERQLQGIEAAKAKGVYKGRQPSIDRGEVRKLKKRGMGATEISDRLHISRASVYLPARCSPVTRCPSRSRPTSRRRKVTKQASSSVPSRRNQRRRVDVLVRGSYAMKPRLCSLAAAVVFVLCAAAGVFAADTDDDPCSGAKPFREVAQESRAAFDRTARV